MKYVEWQWRILREKCGITEAIARFKVLCWRLPGRKPSVTRARVLAQIRTRQEVKPLRTPLLYIIEVPLFLTSALDGDEWSTSRSTCLTPGKGPKYSLNRRLSVPHSRSELFGEDKNLLPLPGFEPRTVQLIAQCLFRTSIWTRHLPNKIRSIALWAVLFGITSSVLGTERNSCFQRTLRGGRPALS